MLWPTVMREMLLGVAATGAYEPLWSDRILEEWARASEKLGSDAVAQARGEAAMLAARWPRARVTWKPSLEERLWLPDRADVHVLAAAVAGSADVIVTVNAGDFPRGVLAEEGVSRADPDAFLLGFWQADEAGVAAVAQGVLEKARRLSGQDWTARGLLKKARLPRLGKAVGAALD